MKLRSVALVGVSSLAALGLIGVGAHAVFTTSTTSGQTITAGTGWTTPPPTTPTVTITYPVNGTTYGTDWGGAITGTVSDALGSVTGVGVSLQQGSGSTSCWTGSGNTYTASCPNYVPVTTGTTTWSLTLPTTDLTSRRQLQRHRPGHKTASGTSLPARRSASPTTSPPRLCRRSPSPTRLTAPPTGPTGPGDHRHRAANAALGRPSRRGGLHPTRQRLAAGPAPATPTRPPARTTWRSRPAPRAGR